MEQTIGRFNITKSLGKGAMGEVFLAHDPDLDREVAIKVTAYETGLSDSEIKEAKFRFLREAQTAARLKHPNIVTIHDMGEHKGNAFIAMEYIQGETLDKYTDKASLLPLPHIIAIIGQTADALAYAHKEGIVHRDIKPSNIMLVKDGGVKITDFGLAKKPTAHLTQDNTLLGTPSYMSPEQIKGEKLDGRSDLFSLGVVLYQLLTGEKPFTGKDGTGKDDTITTIMYKILHVDPPEPTIINSKLPKQFDAIIKKALAKNPGARFKDGWEFKRALENYADYTQRMTRIKPTAPRSANSSDDTLSIAQPPIAALSKTRRMLKTFAKALAVVLLIGGAVALGYNPAKSWVKEKSLDPHFPLPVPLIIWANEGQNPRLEIVTISVKAPDDADVYLDDTLLTKSIFDLKRTDASPHILTARRGCEVARHVVTPEDMEAREIALELKDAEVAVYINSVPEGATLVCDTSQVKETLTPARLILNACVPHRIEFSLPGYHNLTEHIPLKIDEKNEFVYNLVPLPKPGKVLFAKGAYAYSVRYENQVLAHGGQEKELFPKHYQVRIINDEYFLDKFYEFTVEPEKTITITPPLPKLGSITVISAADAQIFLNDKPAGVAPFREKRIASGKCRVKCIPSRGGEVNAKVIEVDIVPDKMTDVRFPMESEPYSQVL